MASKMKKVLGGRARSSTPTPDDPHSLKAGASDGSSEGMDPEEAMAAQAQGLSINIPGSGGADGKGSVPAKRRGGEWQWQWQWRGIERG